MGLKLVENWQSGWKWISMQAGFAVLVINTLAVPQDVAALIPPVWVHVVNMVLGGLVMFGNLVQQKNLQPPGPET